MVSLLTAGSVLVTDFSVSACAGFESSAVTSSADAFCAAASISEDVMTLRLAGVDSDTEGVGADLDEHLETGFFADFPDTFFLETAIDSTS